LIFDTVEDSEKHVQAENLLDSLDRLLIPPLVLYEYIWFFKRQGLEGNEVKELVDRYLTDPYADSCRQWNAF
jgi:predicted nucleic acid-binding protein